MTVASWILFTLPVGFIHPPVVSCKFWNGSTYLLQEPGYSLFTSFLHPLLFLSTFSEFCLAFLHLLSQQGLLYFSFFHYSLSLVSSASSQSFSFLLPRFIYLVDPSTHSVFLLSVLPFYIRCFSLFFLLSLIPFSLYAVIREY